MLQAGQSAPRFTLPDADMASVDLARFRGKRNVVLYFYPRDGTPGCTLQAAEFSDHEEEFTRHDCVVIGVSPDDCIRHAEFRDENGLSVMLLSDPDGATCRKYGVLIEKNDSGQTRTCIQRATFIIDKTGILRQAIYGVNPRGHCAEVLDLVKGMSAGGAI